LVMNKSKITWTHQDLAQYLCLQLRIKHVCIICGDTPINMLIHSTYKNNWLSYFISDENETVTGGIGQGVSILK
ncbi:uncharacterized protein SPAPADRAFT_62130, partial [Spathaspora passalidarum NRRL Y-27907]